MPLASSLGMDVIIMVSIAVASAVLVLRKAKEERDIIKGQSVKRCQCYGVGVGFILEIGHIPVAGGAGEVKFWKGDHEVREIALI